MGTNTFIMRNYMEQCKEQCHSSRGTKPFALRNNFEVYEEQPNRLRGTNPYIVRNNTIGCGEHKNNLNYGSTCRKMRHNPIFLREQNHLH
jgi:hypothetical protein